MIALGIDPGPENSGFVFWDMEANRVLEAGHATNWGLLEGLRGGFRMVDVFYLETIEPMGLRVGASTFETMRWVGRFQEAWEWRTKNDARLVTRGDEKIILCGRKTYPDPHTGRARAVSNTEIRQALVNMFPPGKGTKKAPGPLYGVSKHAWSALAVVITGLRTEWKRQ